MGHGFDPPQGAGGVVTQSDLIGLLPMGELWFNSVVATDPPDTNYLKAAGGTELKTGMDFDMPANNRLRYTGSQRIHAHCGITLSFSTESSNVVCHARAYVYDDSAGAGATLAWSEVIRKAGGAGDIGSTALHFMTVLDQNDYIELWLKNATSATDMTVQVANVFAVGVPIS